VMRYCCCCCCCCCSCCCCCCRRCCCRCSEGYLLLDKFFHCPMARQQGPDMHWYILRRKKVGSDSIAI
jgi:hypothetical protein